MIVANVSSCDTGSLAFASAGLEAAATNWEPSVTAEAGKMPDLVLIDGGKGQVGAARAALEELGLHQVCVVGVAKGPERKPGMEELIIEAESRSLQLPPSHPGLHLIQAIRDEAHRFAIVGHRARRGKARTTSMLNEIPGIGSKRRQALIEHFVTDEPLFELEDPYPILGEAPNPNDKENQPPLPKLVPVKLPIRDLTVSNNDVELILEGNVG